MLFPPVSFLLTGHSMSTLVGREAGLSRLVPARPLLGAWLPAAWVVSALRSWACRRMIFPSNWFGDLEERGVQQHAVAAVLCVGEQRCSWCLESSPRGPPPGTSSLALIEGLQHGSAAGLQSSSLVALSVTALETNLEFQCWLRAGL